MKKHTFCDFEIVVDEAVPPNTLILRDTHGHVVATATYYLPQVPPNTCVLRDAHDDSWVNTYLQFLEDNQDKYTTLLVISSSADTLHAAALRLLPEFQVRGWDAQFDRGRRLWNLGERGQVKFHRINHAGDLHGLRGTKADGAVLLDLDIPRRVYDEMRILLCDSWTLDFGF